MSVWTHEEGVKIGRGGDTDTPSTGGCEAYAVVRHFDEMSDEDREEDGNF